MIYELEESDYEKVRSIFEELHYHLTVFAIIEGNSPGRVYVDNVDNPQTAFVWDKVEGGFFLAGYEHNAAFNQELNERIVNRIYPEAKTIPQISEYTFHYFPDTWESQVDVVLKSTNPMKHNRKHFTFKQLNIVDWRDQVPDGSVMMRIDERLLARTDLKNIDEVTRWVIEFQQSVENFVGKGFGFCLVYEDEIAGWCITDRIAGKEYEVGIATDESYRRRGVATLTATATVEFALANGAERIGWHCWSSNVASAATAEKVGFVQTIEYPMYNACFNRFDNLLLQAHYHFQAERLREAVECCEKAFEMKETGDPEFISSPHLALYPNVMRWFYFAAGRAWASLGEHKAAFRNLNKAIDNGWSNIERLRTDEMLRSLHRTREWKEIVEKLEGV